MKIVDIVPRVVWKEMSGTLRNPRLRWTRKQVMLVFVVAEDGIVGVGETWSDGGSAEPLVSFLEQDLKPRLDGRDVDLVERFWAEALDIALISTRRSLTWQLMSAIDVALWDIRILTLFRQLMFKNVGTTMKGEHNNVPNRSVCVLS
jgi:L-alanine-DL-glutamate epimerase-like enolase superfamily enzyme